MINDELKKLVGELPPGKGFKSRMRFHQGWWRAFVLGKDQGEHPSRKNQVICNTIRDGKITKRNFLSPSIVDAVTRAIHERKTSGSGILEQDRLFNNLLSSQPLCFNFFGELAIDIDFALQVLKQFYSDLTNVNRVLFEYAPSERYTNDNSAFDVAFEVMAGSQTGLIGFECKYTDSFSSTRYDKKAYRQIFDQSQIFSAPYKDFIASKYNQLFRNQLVAESLVQNGKYDFVLTGLFCHPDDRMARKTGISFQNMLKGGKAKFQVITYQDFIKAMQQLETSWDRRELSMLLWARYCGIQLSQAAYS